MKTFRCCRRCSSRPAQYPAPELSAPKGTSRWTPLCNGLGSRRQLSIRASWMRNSSGRPSRYIGCRLSIAASGRSPIHLFRSWRSGQACIQAWRCLTGLSSCCRCRPRGSWSASLSFSTILVMVPISDRAPRTTPSANSPSAREAPTPVTKAGLVECLHQAYGPAIDPLRYGLLSFARNLALKVVSTFVEALSVAHARAPALFGCGAHHA